MPTLYALDFERNNKAIKNIIKDNKKNIFFELFLLSKINTDKVNIIEVPNHPPKAV